MPWVSFIWNCVDVGLSIVIQFWICNYSQISNCFKLKGFVAINFVWGKCVIVQRWRCCDLEWLIGSCQVEAQAETKWRDYWIEEYGLLSWKLEYNLRSSANSLNIELPDKTLSMSLIKRIKKWGPGRALGYATKQRGGCGKAMLNRYLLRTVS